MPGRLPNLLSICTVHFLLRYVFPLATLAFLLIAISKARGANPSDQWESILTCSQYVGMAITAALGVISALTETRNEGKVTPWGWTALWIGLTGFVVAIGAQIATQSIDAKKGEDERQQETQRASESAQMLASLQRELDQTKRESDAVNSSRRPLESIRLSTWVTMPWDDPAFGNFRKDIETRFAALKPDNSNAQQLGIWATGWGNGKPFAAEIPVGGAAFPTPKTFPVAAEYLILGRPVVSIFSANFDFKSIHGSAAPRIDQGVSLIWWPNAKATKLEYDPRTKTMVAQFDCGLSASADWETDGTTPSLNLLKGGHFGVCWPERGRDPTSQRLLGLTRQNQVVEMTANFNAKFGLHCRQNQIEVIRTGDADGLVIHAFSYPNDDDFLMKPVRAKP
jgi:hypothetical protein